MNIVQSANRDTVRTQVTFLNNVLGRKVFVQPRSKNINGVWSPAFKGGVISCPTGIKGSSKPRITKVVGSFQTEGGSPVSVLVKRSRVLKVS